VTRRLIDIYGPPTPEQARFLVVRLGLAAGPRHGKGAAEAPAAPKPKTVHPQAS
jgi:hypothetical protein